MPFINYALASLISFSGIIVGLIIAHFSKEELKPGKKYFVLIKKLILSLMLILFIININLYMLIVSSLVILALMHYFGDIHSRIVYPFLAILFALSFGTKFFFTMSALIFMYGLPAAASLPSKHYFKTLIDHTPYLAVSLLLYLFFV